MPIQIREQEEKNKGKKMQVKNCVMEVSNLL